MQKNIIASALAAGLLVLALTGCSAGGPGAGDPSSGGETKAVAEASQSPSASESPARAVESGYLYKNPVRPAGEGESELLISWSHTGADGEAVEVPGTDENPSGIDFTQLKPSEEFAEYPATAVFTQKEIEKYAAEGMAKYLTLRSDPRLFIPGRDFENDAAVMEDHRENLGDLLYTEWHKQEHVMEGIGFTPIWVLAGGEAEEEVTGEVIDVDPSIQHGLSIQTPAVSGWVDDAGAKTLVLEFEETLSMGLVDGRVATPSATQTVSFQIVGGELIIGSLNFKGDSYKLPAKK